MKRAATSAAQFKHCGGTGGLRDFVRYGQAVRFRSPNEVPQTYTTQTLREQAAPVVFYR
jgi:hypothetical protein